MGGIQPGSETALAVQPQNRAISVEHQQEVNAIVANASSFAERLANAKTYGEVKACLKTSALDAAAIVDSGLQSVVESITDEPVVAPQVQDTTDTSEG